MAKDAMFSHTAQRMAPLRVVRADNKKLARLNCIRHLLSLLPYEDLPRLLLAATVIRSRACKGGSRSST
jgi:hypothetical protein